jgi:hypothetical protein
MQSKRLSYTQTVALAFLVMVFFQTSFSIPVPGSGGLSFLASSEDTSVKEDLYRGTCFTYPCDDFMGPRVQGPSVFPSLGLRPAAAESVPGGSSVFLTSKDGMVILIDGMPLGANAIGEDPRYNMVEDKYGKLISVCDNTKGSCFIPSRLEFKSPSDVPIILRTYEDIMQERENKKNDPKKASPAPMPSPHDTDDGPDFTDQDPETRDPGAWNSCRSSGVSGEQAPDNSRACLNAYNNGVDAMGRKDFIPVDCASNFVGPLQAEVSAQCEGRVSKDLKFSDTDPDLAKGSEASEASEPAKEEGDESEESLEEGPDGTTAQSLEDLLKPSTQPPTQPPTQEGESELAEEDSPEAGQDLDPQEATGVPLEQVTAFSSGVEGPGDEALANLRQGLPATTASSETIDVPLASGSLLDQESDDEFAEDEDESFYKGDWLDNQGNLQGVENETTLDKGEKEELQDFLGGEAQTLEAQSRAWEQKRKSSKTPGELELEDAQDSAQPSSPKPPKAPEPDEGDNLESLVEEASAKLLTRDKLTGVLHFVENRKGQVIMGQTIKSKAPKLKKGEVAPSLSKDQVLKEFNFTEPQYKEYLARCKQATQDFQTGTLMDCLRENLDKFADFLIRNEE